MVTLLYLLTYYDTTGCMTERGTNP